ncbi:hypothetical protein BGZ54_006881 [Gamsiella multidivaricata]|nr:hypothetical protein BGZ54_006881 [Gamsiella multidivaricata]
MYPFQRQASAPEKIPVRMNQICGLFYLGANNNKQFLPLVDIVAHTTILSTTSRTTLTQTYFNPSERDPIKEVQYTFPLYEGVSVVGFTCRIGNRIIVGQVKEREKAKKVFHDAVAQGKQAILLEQLSNASDIFTTTVGNIAPGANIVVEITYLGELKHDAAVDGIRFTIPTVIMPRYGDHPVDIAKGYLQPPSEGRIQITVDVAMEQASVIQQIQSPSHPIAVSLGTTSLAPNAEPVMSKASATLSLGSAGLEKDFVIQVVTKDIGMSTAILETHPTIPNHRALMATLVPRFLLPPERPEIVFICDRSGSMSGSRIELVKSALKVFLKSLPVGVKFNICSFGGTYSFLWGKSQTYDQSTLKQAEKYVERMNADMGGTEMLKPIKATLKQRYRDISLEVMLLTDGEIWDQQKLFSYLNEQVIESKVPIRVFTLGVGNDVSHALIEGVAKAGNGFSQVVGEGERMEKKIVRMLKGALSPHVVDYSLEVKYVDENRMTDTDEDDFELVEKVADSLTVKLDLSGDKRTDPEPSSEKQKKPISFFDMSVDLDKDASNHDETGQRRYAHLPPLAPPKLLQAPHIIPPLFAFNRTSVYLLMGPECSHLKPKSVVLRGVSAHGPLELEIPIQVLETPGETIHQLAAKRAIAELEQGRGWITQAKDEDGVLIKSKHESQFEHMVEREAVRLGVQFQVGGKWCSFVAVDSEQDGDKAKEPELLNVLSAAPEAPPAPPIYRAFQASVLHAHPSPPPLGMMAYTNSIPHQHTPTFGAQMVASPVLSSYAPPMHASSFKSASKSRSIPHIHQSTHIQQQQQQRLFRMHQSPARGFGSVQPQSCSPSSFRSAALPQFETSADDDEEISDVKIGSLTAQSSALAQSARSIAKELVPQSAISRAPTKETSGMKRKKVTGKPLFGSPSGSSNNNTLFGSAPTSSTALFGSPGGNSFGGSPVGLFGSTAGGGSSSGSNLIAAVKPAAPQGGAATLAYLVDLQTFEGSWAWRSEMLKSLNVAVADADKIAKDNGWDVRIMATALAVVYFEKKLAKDKDTWELVVEKAKDWMEQQIGHDGVEVVLKKAAELVAPGTP